MPNIIIRDFGPIERARVDVRPLTLMIGPNNAGKSVAAMLVYAVMLAAARRGLADYRTVKHSARSRPPDYLDDALVLELSELHMSLAAGRDVALSRRILDFFDHVLDEVFTEYMHAIEHQIERCFSTRFETMSRRTARSVYSPYVQISDDLAGWSARMTLLDGERSRQYRLTVSLESMVRDIVTHLPKGLASALCDFPRGAVWSELRRVVRRRLLRFFPVQSYYLPAERSGILQSHRALASFMVRQAPFVGIEDFAVPRMSGVVGDFIGNLIQLDSDDEKTAFSPLANQIERSMLDGSIEIRTDPSGYPDVSYTSAVAEFPLHRSSSMISEVAPVVLYLRYMLRRGELLIIEEPESHLHPRSQRVMAEIVGRVVAGGARVLLTTHSDYFLHEVNNAIRSEFLRARERSRDTLLTFEGAGAYLFERKGRATAVNVVDIDPIDGISDSEFLRVVEELYARTSRLEDEISQTRT